MNLDEREDLVKRIYDFISENTEDVNIDLNYRISPKKIIMFYKSNSFKKEFPEFKDYDIHNNFDSIKRKLINHKLFLSILDPYMTDDDHQVCVHDYDKKIRSIL